MSCWTKAHHFFISRGLFKDEVDPMKEEDVSPDKMDD
jgi:hypothetical protein